LRDNPTAIANLHCTKHDSSDPATKNDFSRDYKDHLNIETLVINFKIPVVCDFDLRKKIILLIHVIFLLSMLHLSQITDYLWNVLQVLLSTSLLHVLEEYEKLVMIIFLLFHIIIEILYAAACVAVSNLIPALMQRAFVCGLEGVAA